MFYSVETNNNFFSKLIISVGVEANFIFRNKLF